MISKITKKKKCRIVKRGSCHVKLCCNIRRKKGKLISKKCYKASKLMCGIRKFVRKCRLNKKRIVCCTRGYKNKVKLYHKCKAFSKKLSNRQLKKFKRKLRRFKHKVT